MSLHNKSVLVAGGSGFIISHLVDRLGNCCYIGPQRVINCGVIIGDRFVVGVNSYVNCDIFPFSIAYGTPPRIVESIKITDDDQVIKIKNTEGREKE